MADRDAGPRRSVRGGRRVLGGIVLAMTLACLCPATGRAGGRTIVGAWAPYPGECTPTAGLIAIGPLVMIGDEMACHFDDVVRSGDVVTWHGRCGFPEDAKPATVVAELKGKSLFVDIDGDRSGPYRRCTP